MLFNSKIFTLIIWPNCRL